MKKIDRLLLFSILILAAFIVFRPYAMPPTQPMMSSNVDQVGENTSIVPLSTSKVMITDNNPQSDTYGKFVILSIANNEQTIVAKGNWKAYLQNK